MDKSSVTQVNADVRKTCTLGVKKHEIGGLQIRQFNPRQLLRHRRRFAGHLKIELSKNVVHQTAAIKTSTGRLPSDEIGLALHARGVRDHTQGVHRVRDLRRRRERSGRRRIYGRHRACAHTSATAQNGRRGEQKEGEQRSHGLIKNIKYFSDIAFKQSI